MLGSNDMKDVSKDLGDVMNPGAHRRVFRSTLKFVLWYKTLASEK